MGVLKAMVTALAVLVLVTTALPFIRTDEWWVRVCDFPRLQIACAGLILLVLITFWPGYGGKARLWLCGLLCVAVAAQAWHLFPYTKLSRKQVLDADAAGPVQRISRLLDPRVGRGLYSTFHVRTPFLRFPLDHFFIPIILRSLTCGL